MSIDILEYELKYKNDQMVLDLISEMKSAQEFLNCEDEEHNAALEKIEELDSTISEHENNRDSWQEDVDHIIDLLNDDLDGEKDTLKFAMERAIEKLKTLSGEMS